MSEETLLETVCRVLDYPAPPKEPEFYRPTRFSQPGPETPPIDRWMDVYIRELTTARQQHPEEYMWPIENIGKVAANMRAAFISGNFVREGHAIKATCKFLAVPYTYSGIKKFLAGEQ